MFPSPKTEKSTEWNQQTNNPPSHNFISNAQSITCTTTTSQSTASYLETFSVIRLTSLDMVLISKVQSWSHKLNQKRTKTFNSVYHGRSDVTSKNANNSKMIRDPICSRPQLNISIVHILKKRHYQFLNALGSVRQLMESWWRHFCQILKISRRCMFLALGTWGATLQNWMNWKWWGGRIYYLVSPSMFWNHLRRTLE